MNIQKLIRKHWRAWIEADKQVMPDLQDALCFMVEEVGEAMAAFMRLPGNIYFRHHPRQSSEIELAVELFDVIMMAIAAMEVLGADLMEVAEAKLAYGDAKRGLWYDPETDEFHVTEGVMMEENTAAETAKAIIEEREEIKSRVEKPEPAEDTTSAKLKDADE